MSEMLSFYPDQRSTKMPTFFPYNCDNNRTGVQVLYYCVSQIVDKF